MILKIGSKGPLVKTLQLALNVEADGIFGLVTEKAVKEFQKEKGLEPDGIVGPLTWDQLELASTDKSEVQSIYYGDLVIEKHFLPINEYFSGPVKKEYIFLHHTAGWDNPFKTIDDWARDSRGAIATEFCIGGQSIYGSNKFDGKVAQAFPEGGYAWHLGANGSQYMHIHSVGIELCNFGFLTKGGFYKYINGKKTWQELNKFNYYAWQGSSVVKGQIVTLDKEFKGHRTWHKYSDKQLQSTKKLLEYIAQRDNIDLRKGVQEWIKKDGVDKAFSFREEAWNGSTKGLLLHVNTNKEKVDLFPQAEVVDMIMSL